jgi:hypothetical protein
MSVVPEPLPIGNPVALSLGAAVAHLGLGANVNAMIRRQGGVSGISDDMRDLRASNGRAAADAAGRAAPAPVSATDAELVIARRTGKRISAPSDKASPADEPRPSTERST